MMDAAFDHDRRRRASILARTRQPSASLDVDCRWTIDRFVEVGVATILGAAT